MLRVLGLDLSLLSTGACVLEGEPGQEPDRRTFLFPQARAKTPAEKIDRLISLAEQVVDLADREQPTYVIIEAPAMNQQWQAAAIGEVHGVIKVQLRLAFGIVPMVKQATHMRKHVVGKFEKTVEEVVDKKGKKKRRVSYGKVLGKSGKMRKATVKDMIALRLKEKGFEFPSDDEMDAYVAARYCWDAVVSPAGCTADDSEKDNEGAEPSVA
jgi:Holliday junction resolvasome RuvABC endonuclease subunit